MFKTIKSVAFFSLESVSALLAAGALLALASVLPAQGAQGNTLTLTVRAGQQTTGAGSLGVTVAGHGYVPINVPPGTNSQGVANAIATQLTALGFSATLSGSSVSVTALPGNQPLQAGGGIGSTDPGISWIKAKVQPPPAPVGGPAGGGGGGAPAGGAAAGGAAPQAGAGQVAPQGGNVNIVVGIKKLINGVLQLFQQPVQVPVVPGDTGQDLNDRMRQALEAMGLHLNDIETPDAVDPFFPVPQRWFGIYRTIDGERVESIEFFVDPWLFHMFPNAAVLIVPLPLCGFGESAHGWVPPTVAPIPFTSEPFLFGQGLPKLGETVDIQAEFPVDQGLGFLITGLVDAIVPLPVLHHDAFLLVDPFIMATEFAPLMPLGPGTGMLQGQLPLPPNPQLAGLSLHLQGVVLDPQGLDNSYGTQRLSFTLR